MSDHVFEVYRTFQTRELKKGYLFDTNFVHIIDLVCIFRNYFLKKKIKVTLD